MSTLIERIEKEEEAIEFYEEMGALDLAEVHRRRLEGFEVEAYCGCFLPDHTCLYCRTIAPDSTPIEESGFNDPVLWV